jgi:hypothetical protein
LAVTMDHLVLDRIEKKKETAVSDRWGRAGLDFYLGWFLHFGLDEAE